jgi:H+-translocating NAD(P) transhydrogenase subunit alpha
MSPHPRDRRPIGSLLNLSLAGLLIGLTALLAFPEGTARSALAQSDSDTTGEASEPDSESNADSTSEFPSEPTTDELLESTPESRADSVSDTATGTTARQPDLIGNLAIFVLAVFVGFEVITKVPPTLHTPLMSGSNAISGITLVGAITIAGTGVWGLEPIVGFLAVILATINVVGGFAVTHRMLSMFRKR